MNDTQMKTILHLALASDDEFDRAWAYAQAIVRLGSVEELEMAQAILNADTELREKVEKGNNNIKHEIGLRQKWIPEIHSVDEALSHHSRVAERTKGIGYKVALLEFSNFCSCDVGYTCQQLGTIIMEFDSGKDEVKFNCGDFASGQWPNNHYPSVLSAMTMFSQRPCWVIRHLFLPELGECSGFGTLVLKRKKM